MTKIKLESAAIAVVVVAGAYIAGGALSPAKPAVSTDCDSGWISQTIDRARQELTPQSSGIPEGERRQMAEVFKVPPEQIKLSQPHAAPISAPIRQSFNPSTPGAVPLTESNAATPDELRQVRQAKGRTLYLQPAQDSTQAAIAQQEQEAPSPVEFGDVGTAGRDTLIRRGYKASDVMNMDDAQVAAALAQGRGL